MTLPVIYTKEQKDRLFAINLEVHVRRFLKLIAEYEGDDRMIVWLGAVSGILLVAAGLTAVYVSRRELNLARIRTDLAASVAHELRTPLAGQRLLL